MCICVNCTIQIDDTRYIHIFKPINIRTIDKAHSKIIHMIFMNEMWCFFVILFATGTESSPFLSEESSVSPNSRNIFYSSGIPSHTISDNSNSNGQLITTKPTAVSGLFGFCHSIIWIVLWVIWKLCGSFSFPHRTGLGHINGDQEGHAKISHCTYQQRKHHDAVVAPATVS